jgi:NAD(P)-dependent dehydrogenase (short-subunit alcohol dehydrogenase family)
VSAPSPSPFAPPAACRVALVTGARSGIGFHTALLLARRGFKVYAGLRQASDAGALMQEATRHESGLAIMPVTLDVTDPDARRRVIEDIGLVDGRLDVLVNNAGISLDGPLELVTDAELHRIFDVNVFGAFGLTREALPLMRARGQGRVIMVSSMSGRMALPAMGAYAASKFALEGLSEAWQHELRPFGIDLVLVEPGPYRTELFRPEAMSAMTREAVGAPGPYRALVDRFVVLREAVGRTAGDPSDVAGVIAELATARKVPLRVPVGASARLRSLAKRLLPDGALSRIVGSVFGGDPSGPIQVRVKTGAPSETPPSPPTRWGKGGRPGGGPTS